MSRRVLVYRLCVLALALFYFIDRFSLEDYRDFSDFGWQFRYLTIWALTGSLIAAAAMLVPGLGAPGPRWSIYVSVIAVINAIVVYLYWRIYLDDPSLIYGDNAIVWWRDYYLHLAGPLLQWIDVLFIKRAFRFPLRVAAWLAVMVVAYAAWAELVVGPLNDGPVGSVTSGLPYPFMNDMVFSARLRFYVMAFLAGLLLIAVFRGAQYLVDRFRPLRPA
ncbi:MAG: hypothetical protein AAGH83_06150 [Pseudomonadota bacterium]